MTGTRTDGLKEKIKYISLGIENTRDGAKLETPGTLEREREGEGEREMIDIDIKTEMEIEIVAGRHREDMTTG